MSHGARAVPPPSQGELLPELRGGSAAEPDAVPPVRAKGSRVRHEATGREDIELAVAASGLKLGDRVTMEGEITYLSADSRGNVWVRVQFAGCGVDCYASELRQSPAGGEK